MTAYRLASFSEGDRVRPALVVDERIYPLSAFPTLAGYATMHAVFGDWDRAEALIERAAEAASGGLATDAVVLAAPLIPSSIFCAGANYSDHVREMSLAAGKDVPPDPHTQGLKPWHFLKSAGTVCGPNASVPVPEGCKRFDFEVELAAIIGRTAFAVSEADALTYVAGYTIANDLSARDLSRRPPLGETNSMFYDWLAHKSFDGSLPLGPWIVPASAIADPQQLGLKLWVNDALKQDSNTNQMIFTLAEQIAHLSRRTTLYPGDAILTGTPAGVGAGRGEFLQPGDSVRLWCESIGTLTHTIVPSRL